MKRPRQFAPFPRVRYRPELRGCPHCGAPLAYRQPVWAKPVQFRTGVEHLTNLGFRCSNPSCPFPRTVYRSAQAEARQVKGSGYGLAVIVRIGVLRFGAHQTRAEIWRALRGDAGDDVALQISERHVQNLLAVYLALLRASQQDPRERLAGIVEAHGGIILALDGLQPEQGNEQLWTVREVLSGTVLAAANLQQAAAPILAGLLGPIKETRLPVLAVISDAQESLRLAVADVFPGVPHQTFPYHARREAAEPLGEADRHRLVEAKQELRGFRAGEERPRPAEPVVVVGEADAPDSASAVVRDTILARRQTVRERGVLPFDCAGRRVMDSLGALGATVDRCLAKRGTPGWPGGGP
jgi:hypothetical protein